jgi:hypothetical protein
VFDEFVEMTAKTAFLRIAAMGHQITPRNKTLTGPYT